MKVALYGIFQFPDGAGLAHFFFEWVLWVWIANLG
jgi:hypothetical protein